MIIASTIKNLLNRNVNLIKIEELDEIENIIRYFKKDLSERK